MGHSKALLDKSTQKEFSPQLESHRLDNQFCQILHIQF